MNYANPNHRCLYCDEMNEDWDNRRFCGILCEDQFIFHTTPKERERIISDFQKEFSRFAEMEETIKRIEENKKMRDANPNWNAKRKEKERKEREEQNKEKDDAETEAIYKQNDKIAKELGYDSAYHMYGV